MMIKFIPNLMLNKCPNKVPNIHCTSAEFKVACHERIIPNVELGRNNKLLISIGLQPPPHPQATPYIFISIGSCHQLERVPASNSIEIIDYNIVLGVLIENTYEVKNNPDTTIWTPLGLCTIFVNRCGDGIRGPPPQGTVVGIDAVEMLSAEL